MKVSNLLFGLTAFFAMQSYAASISQVDLSSAGSKVSGSYQYFTFHMYYSGAYEQTSIFDEILISESDVGSSISIGSNFTDPQYSNFIEKLTNDVDEELYVFYKVSDLNGRGGGGGNILLESEFFGIPNMSMYSIDGLTLEIDSLSLPRYFQSPCSRLYGCTGLEFSGSLVVEGNLTNVAIPSASWLFFIAISSLFSGRYYRNAL